MRFFKTFFGEYGLIFVLALGLGAFYCILEGDGLCGDAENLCNSPLDCARPDGP